MSANDSFDQRLGSTEWLTEQMFSWKNLILLCLTALMVVVTKGLFILPLYGRKYTINKEELKDFENIDKTLVKDDNKAAAIQYAGYLLGSGLMLRGAFSTNKDDLGDQLLDCLVFSIVGFAFLGVSHLVTDIFVLWGIDSIVKVFRDRNVATAIMVACLHVCTGLILGFSITENASDPLYVQVGSTLLWWLVGHVFLIVFAWIYMLMTIKYDDLELISQDMSAAAVGFGATMIADALLIASPIAKSDSALAVLISWGLGSLILIGLRIFVDLLVLRGRSLDDEIREDNNWGAALIEGASVLSFALIWWSLYRVDKTEECVPSPAD